jgi:hypothetical protein
MKESGKYLKIAAALSVTGSEELAMQLLPLW